MKVPVDVHVHSVASGHAYSTVEELVRAARKRRLKAFVLADHGPGLNCGPHPWHFSNLRVLPERIEGVRVYHGAEANIMDASGGIDIEEYMAQRLDFILAGFHEAALPSGTEEENTRAMIAALENPYVDAISHPGNPAFPVDFRAVAEAAKRAGKALEINDASFRFRKGSADTCPVLARICADLGAAVVLGSDAHWSGDVGRLETAAEAAAAAGIREDAILNARADRFDAYVIARRARMKELSVR